MAMGFILGQTSESTRDSGARTKWKVMAPLNGKMAINT
jgi:hypothetical protein